MALKVFVLENSTTKKKRQTDIQNAVREYLKKSDEVFSNEKWLGRYYERGKIDLWEM